MENYLTADLTCLQNSKDNHSHHNRIQDIDGFHSAKNASTTEVNANSFAAASLKIATATSSFGIAGLDRKQMEQERLTRLGQKRKRSGDDAETINFLGGPRKVRKPEEPVATISQSQSVSNMPLHSDRGTLQFPDGVVKRTWAFGYPREADDIKIEEVIQKQNLELAILSAFQIDVEWITSKLNHDTR